MKHHPILAIVVGLGVLLIIAFGLFQVIDHQGKDAPVHRKMDAPVHVDPYPQGSIGYYTEHGNPVCALVYDIPDPKNAKSILRVVNLFPYYGKHPSARWQVSNRMVPRARATQMCRALGALLWHL